VYEYKAKVDRVVDGDTVDFIVDLGFNVQIKIRGRLAGVNTPERGHGQWAFAGEECTKLLESVAEIKHIRSRDGDGREWWVTIKTKKTEKVGRWIVEIEGVTDRLAEIWPHGESG